MSVVLLPALRLDARARDTLLRAHPQWQFVRDQQAISRYFRFDSFAEAFGFMGAVAIVAESQGHYPEWSNAHDRVEILLTTHDVQGLSIRDARLTERIDELALLFGAGTP